MLPGAGYQEDTGYLESPFTGYQEGVPGNHSYLVPLYPVPGILFNLVPGIAVQLMPVTTR